MLIKMTHLCVSIPFRAYLALSTITLESRRNHIWNVIASRPLRPPHPLLIGSSLKENPRWLAETRKKMVTFENPMKIS